MSPSWPMAGRATSSRMNSSIDSENVPPGAAGTVHVLTPQMGCQPTNNRISNTAADQLEHHELGDVQVKRLEQIVQGPQIGQRYERFGRFANWGIGNLPGHGAAQPASDNIRGTSKYSASLRGRSGGRHQNGLPSSLSISVTCESRRVQYQVSKDQQPGDDQQANGEHSSFPHPTPCATGRKRSAATASALRSSSDEHHHVGFRHRKQLWHRHHHAPTANRLLPPAAQRELPLRAKCNGQRSTSTVAIAAASADEPTAAPTSWLVLRMQHVPVHRVPRPVSDRDATLCYFVRSFDSLRRGQLSRCQIPRVNPPSETEQTENRLRAEIVVHNQTQANRDHHLEGHRHNPGGPVICLGLGRTLIVGLVPRQTHPRDPMHERKCLLSFAYSRRAVRGPAVSPATTGKNAANPCMRQFT